MVTFNIQANRQNFNLGRRFNFFITDYFVLVNMCVLYYVFSKYVYVIIQFFSFIQVYIRLVYVCLNLVWIYLGRLYVCIEVNFCYKVLDRRLLYVIFKIKSNY